MNLLSEIRYSDRQSVMKKLAKHWTFIAKALVS